jgi:hypothetical protein
VTAGETPAAPVEYDPRLVEDGTVAALRGRPEEHTFQDERATLYAVDDPEERETRFHALHAAWFERLGFATLIAAAFSEQRGVAAGVSRRLIAGARSSRDEGAELFVAGSEDPARPARWTLLLRLRPETFRDAARLRALLRRELTHVADMLDPAFGYDPRTLRGGDLPLPEPLLRERYRVLWAVAIAGRLARRGWVLPGTRGDSLREFTATFPMLGIGVEAAFDRIFDGDLATHTDLLAFAARPGGPPGATPARSRAGERCPLCRCATHDFEPEPLDLPPAARELIRQSIPEWNPADGLCRQCADLYRARMRLDERGAERAR